jgi:hypothetical protein
MGKRAIMETYGPVRLQPYGRYDLWTSDGKSQRAFGSIHAMYEHIDALMRNTVRSIEDER